jgi:hypothetical protein
MEGHPKVTIEEAKAMLGTEFIYRADYGEVKAYVKAFDPEVGLTCYSLEDITSDGWQPDPENVEVDADGTWCVVGFDFTYEHHDIDDALTDLYYIKTTGVLAPAEVYPEGSRGFGNASCSF